MDGANRSLQEFIGVLSSPDMYGSMSTAASLMGWFLHLVVVILMVAAIIGIGLIMFKFACDIIMLSGLGQMMGGGGNFAQRFASEGALSGDVIEYLKKDSWKLVITLGFIGVLASGMALPLAGQVAGIMGAAIDKLVGADLATKAYEFNFSDFSEKLKYYRSDELKNEYDAAIAEMDSYRNQIYAIGSQGKTARNDSTLDNYKQMYAVAFQKAQAVAKAEGTKALSSNLPASYFEQHSNPEHCVSDFLTNTKTNSSGASPACKSN